MTKRQKDKVNKFLDTFGCIISVVILAWLFISFLDVNVNRPNVENHKWNAFVIITSFGESDEETTQSMNVVESVAMAHCNVELTTEEVLTYTEDDVELLAHVIYAEVGCDWYDDELLYYAGNVVLNRVDDEGFPNSIYGVISQKGQYSCMTDGNFDKHPSDRAYRIAEDLLKGNRPLPSNVVYQSGTKQGNGTYAVIEGVYFCYK